MENIERLIVDMKESLERDMQSGFSRIEKLLDEANARFDVQSARLDRHGALLQTGSRWTNRMNQWSEKVDAALNVRDKQIADLRARIERLENRGT
jgi:hypothetical protein